MAICDGWEVSGEPQAFVLWADDGSRHGAQAAQVSECSPHSEEADAVSLIPPFQLIAVNRPERGCVLWEIWS